MIALTPIGTVRSSRNDLRVEGLDSADGTPVLDIKPVMREFLPHGAVRQPSWATELMAGYWA